MLTSAEEKQILKDDQAAEMLGLRRQTLAVWRMNGTGPRYIKAGRLVRYRRGDLEKWLAENTIEPGAQSASREA